jgi:endonuclease/exonuclease/phosphatase family metal-dependent hydrolase
VQVNRSLRTEFIEALVRDPWEIALLQEAPPRWHEALCRELGAVGAMARTSRNWLPPLQGAIAELLPDLIGSLEGGSNQILARAPWRISDARTLVLTRLPERRVLLAARLEHPGGRVLWVANLHASFHSPAPAAREVAAAADAVARLAAGFPLVFGGDLNLRPRTSPALFEYLESNHGLIGVTAPTAIDHLLTTRLADVGDAEVLPAGWREMADRNTGLLLRLSDHSPVARELVLP